MLYSSLAILFALLVCFRLMKIAERNNKETIALCNRALATSTDTETANKKINDLVVIASKHRDDAQAMLDRVGLVQLKRIDNTDPSTLPPLNTEVLCRTAITSNWLVLQRIDTGERFTWRLSNEGWLINEHDYLQPDLWIDLKALFDINSVQLPQVPVVDA